MLEGLLNLLEVHDKVAQSDLARIPRTGPTIIVANHPFGVLEAVVLVTVLRELRPDVRVLANQLLGTMPELSDVLIPVDVMQSSTRTNARGMRHAIQFVSSGGLLVVFPAGAVSHYHWRQNASVDPSWRPEIARLIGLCARTAPVTVVPMFIPGSNSPTFHAAGFVHPALRTAMLARELFNKKRHTVELRSGHPVSSDRLNALANDQERIDYLRWRTYLLASRSGFDAKTRKPLRRPRARTQATPIDAIPRERLTAEIGALTSGSLLEQTGDLQVFLAKADAIPITLREIGRLREVTFRQAGEGTGREVDLDQFDAHYLHLFVWNSNRQEVVGAYRLKRTDHAEDLYTRTLFQFDDRFLQAMGPAVELGRSFIRTEYQKGFAPLLLLWKGIGKFIAANPQCKTLFGPVSISNQYQAISRELMIGFLERHASLAQWMKLVRSRHAPTASRTDSRCADLQELEDVIGDIEPSQPGIPVLLRQYLKLGGKLLGFNIDPEFSDVLDGLIVVDLTRTEPKLLGRYLGKAEATTFLDFHKEPVSWNTARPSSQ